MSILAKLAHRFRGVLSGLVDDPEPLLDLLRRSQDPRFGDYQANFAMPLGKRLGRPPREVAAEISERIEADDFCLAPEVAGPGFINLKIRDDWIARQLATAVSDDRLGIPEVPEHEKRTYVIDYSAPNVAKPMHVGHIRSTVIGNSLWRTLRFLGHQAVGDNHLGDWGTQFGMIIYGHKHFLDRVAYQHRPVDELARLYRLVRHLIDYHEDCERLPKLEEDLRHRELVVEEMRQAIDGNSGEKPDKRIRKRLAKAESSVTDVRAAIETSRQRLAAVEANEPMFQLAGEHPDISTSVLGETAKLHAGDQENLCLWQEFLPLAEKEIERVYRRLDVEFDHTLGESFYHPRLPGVVDELLKQGIARESDGAICVFFEGRDAPMIVRKRDGAFLYATTDLATVQYRMETWQPDAVLYVVDHRQGLHFEQLFAAVRLMGYEDVELKHVSFGTVLGEDGRPFKTRSGDTVGLEGLLDEAVARAGRIVGDNDDAKPGGAELSEQRRREIAETVGLAAIKYADLSHNRDSDYVFSYDKMLATNGDTATYMQYAYARVRSIFRRGGVDVEALRQSGAAILLGTPAERALGLEILRFSEALDMTVADYRPNQLTSYLFGLANCYSTFFDECHVLNAESDELRQSRLLLCDLTARTIKKGLELLGISVVEQM
jgi:arginyl-tRNA synthetase